MFKIDKKIKISAKDNPSKEQHLQMSNQTIDYLNKELTKDDPTIKWNEDFKSGDMHWVKIMKEENHDCLLSKCGEYCKAEINTGPYDLQTAQDLANEMKDTYYDVCICTIISDEDVIEHLKNLYDGTSEQVENKSVHTITSTTADEITNLRSKNKDLEILVKHLLIDTMKDDYEEGYNKGYDDGYKQGCENINEITSMQEYNQGCYDEYRSKLYH